MKYEIRKIVEESMVPTLSEEGQLKLNLLRKLN